MSRPTWFLTLGLALLGAPGCDPSPLGTRDAGRVDARGGGSDTPGVVDPGTDTDGDAITDLQEGDGRIDFDMDGAPDTMDTDSDGDGFSDRDEAGDADPFTAPVDTDGDGRPDFRDLDSDGDGLFDADEATAGTGRLDPDSDDDGVLDSVEVAAMTDPTDPTDSPRTRGDFFFLVPYELPPEPARDTLVFSTNILRADVHFMIDTSISMQGYIDTVRASLTSTVIPGVRAAIPDVAFGVGQFDICPQSLHRDGICRGIEQNQTSTTDAAIVTTALGTLTADCSPVHEPYAQAAWVWATGDTSRWPRMMPPTCATGEVGLGCVRVGALPILVMIGDEPFSESFNVAGTPCASGTCSSCAMFPSEMETLAAFAAIRGRMIVLGPTGTSPEWAALVRGTGAVDAAGMPLIFPAVGSATVDASIVNAIASLASSTPLDISARARDVTDPGETVDATVFIERIETNTTGGVMDPTDPTVICVGGLPTSDTNADGFPDTFPDVTPGTPVCFDIIARMNTTVMPTTDPQLFRAQIDVVGDGITVLDTRDVYFLVPPMDDTPIIF